MMRNESIDLLRFIGLAMIILTHANPPDGVLQLRSFDVPLMVLVSGMSFHASYREEPYIKYFWKRFKRLVFPAWLFLSCYFLFVYCTAYPIPFPDPTTILMSYLLVDGIGYVWIIRVFLLVAIVSPLIMQINRRLHSHKYYFLLVGALCFVSKLILVPSRPYLNTFGGQIFENTVMYVLPYSAVFAIGLRFPQMTRKQIALFSVCTFLLFVGLASKYWLQSGAFMPTRNFKYPPQIYYLSYALCVSSLLWILSDRIANCLKYLRLSGIVNYIAQNSMWVYLWHIPAVAAIQLPYYLKYSLVFMIAVFFTFLQERLVTLFILPKVKTSTNKSQIRALLTG